MAVVTGALGSVIPKLALLLKEEYDLQKGVRKKITCLSRDLESMHAALRKVGDVPLEQLDEQVKLWARDVREMSYDVEDILDTFLVIVDGSKAREPNRFNRAAKRIGRLFSKIKAHHQIADMIKNINEQAHEVEIRRQRFKIDEIVAKPATTSTVDPRLEAMYKEVIQLVGIEDSSGELTSKLSWSQLHSASNKKLKKVSVVGIGGLGKTTLAKAVYEKLKVEFDCTAFVPVGRNPDLKKFFRDLLVELDKEKYMDLKYKELDERQLIKELLEFLGSKRYFIVIDDIWEMKSWKSIRLICVESNSGSRIIVTTRKLDVANEADDVYKLPPLSYDKSKKLFHTRIFGGEGKGPHNQLDEVSDKILKKCGGVPLAIITMASLLVGKPNEEWGEVCSSTGFCDKGNKQEDDIVWILSLSYYDLPSHLKTCLLYISAFPEDYFIEKGSLIWKWIAEGFITKESGISRQLFEVGEGYLNDLVNRSLIQVAEMEESGDTLEGYRVHDMVLDLLRLKSQEVNFVTISSNAEGTSSQSRARRLVHQNRTVGQTHKDTQMDLRHMRSIIVYSCDIIVEGRFSFLSFELLRVVALEECYHVGYRIHLEHLENLRHLRYFSIRETWIDELPDEIGALEFLQTLDVVATSIAKLPSSIGHLTQLICLRAGLVLVPKGVIRKLTSLEELQIRISDDTEGQFVRELGKLHDLRVLNATFDEDSDDVIQSDLVESLGNLHKMQHLRMGCFVLETDKALWDAAVLPRCLRCFIVPNIYFSVLPSWINPSDHPNLSHLDLHVYDMDEQSLKILGQLPELRHLRLSMWSTVTVTIYAPDGCFQKLRSLSLFNLVARFVLNEDLSVSCTLWSSIDATDFGSETRDECRVPPPTILPNLEKLDFDVRVHEIIRHNGSCGNLGLQYLPSLQKVKVEFGCADAFSDDVEKEEAALRHAIELHPNRPTIQMDIWGKNKVKSRPVAHDLVTEEQEEVGSSRSAEDVTRSSGGGDPV